MNYWLVKFAPFRYSWQDVLRNGKFEIYSVRSPQARNNLKVMKLGDKVLFYQSQKDQSIRGKMKVIEEAHQDKTTDNPKWVSVTFEPVETIDPTIPLNKIKAIEKLQNTGLVKQPRLSVMKLSKDEFDIIISIKKQ